MEEKTINPEKENIKKEQGESEISKNKLEIKKSETSEKEEKNITEIKSSESLPEKKVDDIENQEKKEIPLQDEVKEEDKIDKKPDEESLASEVVEEIKKEEIPIQEEVKEKDKIEKKPDEESLASEVVEEIKKEEIPLQDEVKEEDKIEKKSDEESLASEVVEEIKKEEIPLQDKVKEEDKIEKKSDEESLASEVVEENKKEVTEEVASVEKSETIEEKHTEENPNVDEESQAKNDETKKDEDIVADENEDDKNNEDNETLEEKYNELSREQLVESLKGIVSETDINIIKTRVALIKVAFLKENNRLKEELLEKFISEGNEETEFECKEDEVEKSFIQLFSIYKQNRRNFLKAQEELKDENLIEKKQVLEELKVLINSEETLKKTYDEFKVLQEKWKEIGIIPKGDVNNLWQSYHFLVEKFFDKVKINKELRDLDLKKNFESKIVLCEKTEELLLETSILKSFKELQRYHNQWKEIGPVPREYKDEIWERFKSATDKINERRREHYAKIYENQESNLEAKTALCEKAETILIKEINTIKDWQKTTEEINNLFKVWKSIGSVPKKNNEEIWHRFRTYLNTFFDNKKEYFQKLKDEQINNYNLKVDICVQSESLQDSQDWKETSRKLINLQKEWKNIGPVPRKYSDKIWKRFRSACDTFFNSKSSYFSNIHVHEDDNLKLKNELIEKVNKYEFGEDEKENFQRIKDWQREWTEIGHVPFKEKDKIWKNFRQVIDKHMEKLQISEVEISAMNFKTKMESMKDSPQAKNIIYKERVFLNNKISKLKEDIALWDNNIGFLADSKNADVFKKEFEKKINNAKRDLKIFEAKIRYINSNM